MVQMLDERCKKLMAGRRIAVVGGGLGGLLAARTLCRQGASVTVYEARTQVGGRVLSDTTFANGRIVEAGAELIGSIHTRWCALAKEYGLSLISRMNTELYAGQQLAVKLTLDQPLTMSEVRQIEKRREKEVFKPIAERARNVNAIEPWNDTDPDVLAFDGVSVAGYLKHFLGLSPSSRLWKATEQVLVHDNVARLQDMNFLGLLCLVKGGQQGTIAEDPDGQLMGYWNELEIYRCAEGAQQLAIRIAAEIKAAKDCLVVTNLAVTRIDIPDRDNQPVRVRARTTSGREIDRRLDKLVSPLGLPYAEVIFAVPPSVWDKVEIKPRHPTDALAPEKPMNMGGASKFFSKVNGRFWLKSGAAPYGGSVPLGQVWEGTDNQTRAGTRACPQDTVLSVFAGGPDRLRATTDYRRELTALYPDYPANNALKDTLLVDWEKESFIKAGITAPRLYQIRTVGKMLNEPFLGRLFFAGDHTQMNHFGYMEGAIRSGERAAKRLIDRVCDTPSVYVAGGAPTSKAS